MEEVFDSIFDAFRHFAPNSPLIQLEKDEPYFFRRTNQYEIIDMENGYFGAFPGFPIMLYRGEYKKYKTCKASIFRSGDPDDVVIDELRILEFRNILNTFPQVKYAIEDHMKWKRNLQKKLSPQSDLRKVYVKMIRVYKIDRLIR